MSNSDDIKDELEKIRKELQEQKDSRNRLISFIVVGLIIAVIAFAFWNYHRINGNSPDPAPNCSGATNQELGC